MKKIFLSLLTVFMVLSLSVVLVKASEATTVSLEDGVQIRTDGNNGLKWVANVTNHKEGNEYGFLFAQGDLAEVTVETTGVEKRVVEGVTTEEPIMSATMVNFPKKAATQDISVVAYVLEDGVYSYSSVVVRNLSEVAIEAYEKGIVTGDFVEAIYNASETTFNLNGGQLLADNRIIVTRYNATTDQWDNMANITTKASGLQTVNYNRVLLKYDSSLEVYKVVGVYKVGAATSDYKDLDYDYRLQSHGTPSNAVEKATVTAINEFVKLEDATDYYFKFTVPSSSSNSCYIDVQYSKSVESFTNNQHIGGGENLPVAMKSYYDFAGWYDNAELNGNAIAKQGKERELFAKYTPTNYSISYELGDGEWVENYEPISSYNYESAAIELPAANKVKIEDGTFIGWYDNPAGNGEALTSIPAQSNGDITLYAIWQMDAAEPVELSAHEKSIIGKYSPNKFVSADFSFGKFEINGVEYEVDGGNLFTTLADAISASQNGDVIYLFDGSYTLAANYSISKEITILGPNADLDVENQIEDQAVINSKLKVQLNTAFIEFNGVTISGSGVSGIHFNSTAKSKIINFKSCFITEMKTGFNFETGNGIELLFEDCKLTKFTQFITWVTAGMSKTDVISCYVDATSCGATTNAEAALFRTRSGDLNAYDNYFYGDSKNAPGYFEVTGGGTGVVMYNTFENVSKFQHTGKTNSLTYNENLYLDKDGNVLNAAPANVSKGSAVADTVVCASEEERAEKYAEFSGEEIVRDYYITYYSAPFAQKTLNFNNGGYYTTNATSISYYDKAGSAADGWTWAHKVGLMKDENGLYIVNQFIAAGTALVDADRNSDYYIIASSNYADGYAYLASLTIGNYLEFSGDLATAATVDLVVRQYSKNPIEKVTVHEATTTLAIPTVLGHKFVGWYTSPDFTGSALTTYNFTAEKENVILYSKWENDYYGVAVMSKVSGYETPNTVSISDDGLTITFDGNANYISFQIYNGVEKMTMSPSKWAFTSSNSSVISYFSGYSCLASVVGEGTATLTFTNNADPSIVVEITFTVVLATA